MIIGDLGATTRGFLLAGSPGLVAQTSCDHTNVSFLPGARWQELAHSELAPKDVKWVTGCPTNKGETLMMMGILMLMLIFKVMRG